VRTKQQSEQIFGFWKFKRNYTIHYLSTYRVINLSFFGRRGGGIPRKVYFPGSHARCSFTGFTNLVEMQPPHAGATV